MSETQTQTRTQRGLAWSGFILLLLGVVFDAVWISRQPPWLLYLINLLPGVQLLASWRLSVHPSEKRNLAGRLSIPLAVTALIFAVFINMAVDFASSGNTDLADYPKVVADFHEPEWVAHFPAQAPDQSEDPSFLSLSMFFRRMHIIQLRVTLSPQDAASLLAEYQDKAVHIYQGGDASVHAGLPGGVPTTFFYTNGTDDYTFPDSFTVLVLDAQADKLADDGTWRHGHSYGLAIDPDSGVVVYWLEEW